MKTEHEFFAQVDSLTQASAKSPDRLAKLGDMKSKWRAAAHDQVARQVLCDELDAIAIEVRDEIPVAKPAATKSADKPATKSAADTKK